MPILGRAGIGPVTPTSTAVAARPSFTQLLKQPTMKYAPMPTGGDDQGILQAFIDAANPGDELIFPPGSVYKHSAKVLIRYKPDLYLHAAGDGQFTFQATTPGTAALHIWTDSHRVHIKGLRHTVLGATARDNNAFQAAGWVVDYADYVWLEDCISEGAAGLGWYVFNGNYGRYDRCQVLNSGADAFHLTYGSHDNVMTDLFIDGAGDDYCANIGYLNDGEAGRPHHNQWIRPVGRNGHARGIAFAGCSDTICVAPDFTTNRAASVMFARESGDFNTSNTERCSVTGGKARRSQTPKPVLGSSTNDPAVHAGPILYTSAVTAGVVDCTVDGLSVGDLPTSSAVAQLSGFAPTGTSAVTNLQLFNGTPTQLWTGGQVGSTATWADRRTETMAPTATAVAGSTTTPTSARPPMPTFASRLRADSLSAVADGGSVTSWVDPLGGRTLTPPSAAPIKVANGIGGKPTVRFNGTTQYLEQTSGGPGVASPYTIAYVARLSQDVTGQNRSITWFAGTSGSTGETGVFTGKFGAYGGGYTEINNDFPQANTPYAVITTFDGANGSITVNGKVLFTGDLGSVPIAAGGRMVLGQHGDQDRKWPGDISEVGISQKAWTAADRAAFNSYAQDYYPGLTVLDYVPDSVAFTGAADLTGSGTLSAAASPATGGGAGLSGAGSLISAGTPMATVAAALSGSGGLAAAGTPAASGPAALTGSGSLTATGTPSSSAPAALSGTGTLTATPTPSTSGAGSLSGTGTLAASGAPAQSAPAALSGTGTLAGTGAVKTSGQGALGGSGQLSVSGSGAENGTSTASLSGAGQLAASGSPTSRGAGALTGAGTLAATARPTTGQTAALGGSGQLAASGSGTERATGTATLTGAGQLTATVTPAAAAAGALTGTGQLAAAGQVGDRPPYTPHLYVDATVLPAQHEAALTVDGVSSSTLTEAAGLATLQT